MENEYGKLEQVQQQGQRGTAGLVESAHAAKVAALTADDKKGKDVRILDIRSISTIADYFVICSGSNQVQVRSLADHVEEQVTGLGVKLHHMEGYQNGRWILLDFGDVVVHVMHEEDRSFYSLERLWGDAHEVALTQSEAV